jgi:ribonuclease P protein component
MAHAAAGNGVAISFPARTPVAGQSRAYMKRYGFPKSAHLLRSVDFRKVYTEGRRRNLDWLVVFTLATGRDASRVGFTIPRAFGPAVDRNRARRRLREAVRKNWADLGLGWDIVLHPRRPILEIEFPRMEQAVRKLFQSCARASGEREMQP